MYATLIFILNISKETVTVEVIRKEPKTIKKNMFVLLFKSSSGAV